MARVLSDSACHVLVLEDARVPAGLGAAGRRLRTAAPTARGGASRPSGDPPLLRRRAAPRRRRRDDADARRRWTARGRSAPTALARGLGAEPRARVFYAKHGFRRVGAQAFQFGGDTQTDDVLSRPLSFGVSLAIVAGGSATRLGGVCKPLLRVRGRTVLERLLALRTLADEVLLVSADPRLPDAGLRRVEDVLPGRGGAGRGAGGDGAGERRPGCSRWPATCPSSTAARCFRCSRRAGTTWTPWPTPWPAGSSRWPRSTGARSPPAGRPRSPAAAPRSARSGVGCAA